MLFHRFYKEFLIILQLTEDFLLTEPAYAMFAGRRMSRRARVAACNVYAMF